MIPGIGKVGILASKIKSRKDLIRNKLLSENPYCTYCGIKVIWYKNTGGKIPDNFATLDHVLSKNTGDYNNPENIVVLCCNRCNQNKNYLEQTQHSQ